MLALCAAPLLHGFLLSLAMIMAIGAQNVFVLKQGINGRYVLAASLICAFCDASLIILGSLGLGGFIANYKIIQLLMCILGSSFLAWYAFGAWKQFLYNKAIALSSSDEKSSDLKKIIAMSAAFSFLNPHAWLDTVVVIGSVSSQYEETFELIAFTVGACLVSFIWFLLLGFLAKKFRTFLLLAKVQKGLNLFIAVLMASISISLIRYSFTLL